MSNKLKIATAAGLIAAAIASPAFAQSADHTGSQMASYYDATGKQMWGNWGPPAAASHSHSMTRPSGLNALAKVPNGVSAASYRHSAKRQSGLSAYARVPASGSFISQGTGGGSIGYNENLRTDQW